MKKSILNWMFAAVVAIAGMTMASCSSSDDNGGGGNESAYGVPSDDKAGTAPSVTVAESNVTIPNISAPSVESGTSGKIGNITFTGVKGIDGEFMDLVGTGADAQNIWMTIDGKAKSLAIVNGDEVTRAAKKGLADIVFIVDNSGSMSDEANALAEQIISWSKVIAETVDARFGCVGYGWHVGAQYTYLVDNYGIAGGLNMTTVENLHAFLNREGKYGVDRTYEWAGSDATKLAEEAAKDDWSKAGGENGSQAIQFADKFFNFRDGANRIYINFTDDYNFHAGLDRISVEVFNPANDPKTWTADQGTIHSVLSPWRNKEVYEKTGPSEGYSEWPGLMSQYTGGIVIYADQYYTDFTLNDIEVTAAIVSSYILRFNITDDLKKGTHDIELIIKDKKGSKAKKVFKDVEFSL